jgi:galactonate dehydratase
MIMRQYVSVLQSRVAKIIMLDIAWTGGISEAKKICAMADAEGFPITFHNCGGPVRCSATAHLASATHNLPNVETDRPFFKDDARYSTGFPEVKNGRLEPVDIPGLGKEMRPDMFSDHTLEVERSGEVPAPSTPA